ncbi:MAG: hypothetical protein HYY18_17545 [Planctomycetes bacterium]|nr:hypothetical protein [Planctomycetota bacterium]
MAETIPQDDRLTQMVQAAVSASLARRSAILKPREIEELTTDAKQQLEELLKQRDSDLQRMALLERAREKLQEEAQALATDLQARELTLEEERRTSHRAEQRLLETEREADGLRGALARKGVEAEEVEARIRAAAQEAERAKVEAAAQSEGTPEREQALARVKQLEQQVDLLRESREIMQREMAGLQDSLRDRERELEGERAEHRESRDRVSDLQRQVAALAESARQKRGIELKVFDEMSRAQTNLQSMVEKLAGLERSIEHGPVVLELRREVDRVREQAREERMLVAQLQGQVRDMAEAAARSNAAAAHLRETLAAVEADRDRMDEMLRRERRQEADRKRTLMRRLEELENRPPVGADPASWDRLRGQFESRLREAALRLADAEKNVEDMRGELENARGLLTRATVERQSLRARVETLELASVGPSTEQIDALRAEMKKTEYERDEAAREVAALKSKVEALDLAAQNLERERQRAVAELREKTGGGFWVRLKRAFGG